MEDIFLSIQKHLIITKKYINILKKRYLRKNSEILHIPLLVIITGQKCSLRCKDCGNFTPFLPQTFYDIDAIKMDLKKIAPHISIRNIQIQGGEALLYPDLGELLLAAAPFSRNVTIATNGTKLLTEDQIKTIKITCTTLRISDYGINPKKTSRLTSQCDVNNIPYRMYKFVEGSGNWREMGGRQADSNSKMDTLDIFSNCPFNKCYTLEDGIVARCSRATVAHNIQCYSPENNDLLHIRKLRDTETSFILSSYINNPTPMKACSFCKGSSGKSIPPAVQLKTT